MTNPADTSFTAQPYPLFYAELADDETISTGRIIGWVNPHQPKNTQPVVLLNNPDGSIDRVVYADLGHVPFSWIRDTLNDALAAAEKQLTEGHPDTPTGQLTVDVVRRVWPEVVARIEQSGQRRVAALAQTAQVDEMTEDGIRLSAASPVLVKMLNASTGVLSEAVFEILGVRCGVFASLRAKNDG